MRLDIYSFSNTDWAHALCRAVLHVSQSRGLRSGITEPRSAPLRSEGTGGPEPADRSPSRFTGKLRAQVHPYMLLFPTVVASLSRAGMLQVCVPLHLGFLPGHLEFIPGTRSR